MIEGSVIYFSSFRLVGSDQTLGGGDPALRSPQQRPSQQANGASDPQRCRFCGREFKTSWNCKRHELIHTGVKPFTCRFCNKSFNQRINLVGHERLHTGLKPYPCQYCGILFSRKSGSRSHEQTCRFKP